MIRLSKWARTFAAGLFASAMLAASAAPKEKPTRLDVTSQPEAAAVFLDGEHKGITPLTLFDIAPGEHHLRFELKDYEPHDDFFSLAEGSYTVRNAALVPVKGLLLITTEPEGCSISQDGFSLGETPRLITSLDAKGVYRLTLQKAGYQRKMIEVRFQGRTPLVRHEKLILDSGILQVTSSPEGATVVLNGVDRGVTPLSLSDVPKGPATLEISKEGYVPQKRNLVLNAGDTQNVDVTLEGRPGSLFLVSVPDGARFYVNDQAHGKGPVTIQSIAPGVYTVRAEKDGCASVTKEVRVGLGQSVSEEFRLESVLGRLEVRTVPAGAQVVVDGHPAGATKIGGASEEEISDVLAVENLEAGEHTLTVRKDGYAETVKHPVIENLRTTPVTVRLRRVFKPNVRLTTATGVYEGVLVNSNSETITLEVSMGITRTFPREDARIEYIGN